MTNASTLEIYVILLVITALLFGLASFIVFFIIQYKKKQELAGLEKKALQVQYEQEILLTNLETQEKTMQTIALDLHDNIGQMLSLISLTVSSVPLDNTEIANKRLASAKELCSKTIVELRQISKMLHGSTLQHFGLIQAIKLELDYLNKSGAVEIDLDFNLPNTSKINKDVELILYRLFQEIINNALRHSRAKKLHVNLLLIENQLKMIVKDDGIGFDLSEIKSKKAGLGLQNMQKRVSLLNGKVVFRSEKNKGTEVEVSVPL